jgi:hypothetical protein
MSRPNLTIDDLEAKFSSLRASISEYDEINCQVLVVLEACAKRVNNIIRKFSVNLK